MLALQVILDNLSCRAWKEGNLHEWIGYAGIYRIGNVWALTTLEYDGNVRTTTYNEIAVAFESLLVWVSLNTEWGKRVKSI